MLAMLPTVMVVAVTPVAVAPPLPLEGVSFPLGPHGPLLAPPLAAVVVVTLFAPVTGPVEPDGVVPVEPATVVVVAPLATVVVVPPEASTGVFELALWPATPLLDAPRASACWAESSREPQDDMTSAPAERRAMTARLRPCLGLL
jgi:hypothetical protein